MGEIIAFPLERRARRLGAHPAAGDVKILFFMGVRYEKMDDPPAPISESPPATGSAAVRVRKRKQRA